MDCVLFRHGIAVERDEWKGEDAERPLTEKGGKRVRQAAAGLRALDVFPTHLLTSPLVRAHETAKILQAAFRHQLSLRICDELLTDAPPDKVFPLIEVLPPDACVICIGHEPYLGETAGLLLFGKPAAGLSLKKAGACLIEMPDPPRPGRGYLHWWLPPAQLRALAKTRE